MTPFRSLFLRSGALVALAGIPPLIAAAQAPPAQPLPPPPVVPADREVRATVLTGQQPATAIARPVQIEPKRGDISLNFPEADVRVVAQAVLGDILRLPFTVAPGTTATVTLVTARPVARTALMALFEDALRASGLAMLQQNGTVAILPLEQARTGGTVVGPDALGFGTETVQLQFVNADEIRKLLEPILPGVVGQADAARNVLVISGTTGQRANARDLLRQFDVNWLRNMSFALFVPQRTDSRLIVPELEKLINGTDAPTRGLVRLIAMERLNGILAISTQRQYLEDVRRWVEILDREGQNNERRLFVYRVQNGRSRDLAKTLNTAFGNSTGNGGGAAPIDPFASDPARGGTTTPINPRQPLAPPEAPGIATAPKAAATDAAGDTVTASISSDETNNAIIVFGTPRDYAVIEDALRKLDVLPSQVLIEAAITEVTLNNDLRYGVQWNFQRGDTNFALTDTTGPTPTRLFPGFSFFFSNNSDISATLNALEQRTKINVISSPKLLVLNNQTAALQVGDQVPISTQSSVGVQNPDSPIVNSIEYKDTGVILKVTPRVNAGGLVLLDISQEVSDVKPNSNSGIDSPTIATRRISTTVAVQDGQVIALGGLIRDNKSVGKSGIPLLSRLPLIGGLLFGATTRAQDRTELLVLLKPRVLRSIDDGRTITDELRQKIRLLAPILRSPDAP